LKELDELIEQITVDCYDDDELVTAFCEVLGDEIPVPFEVTVLGMPAQVTAVGHGRTPGVMATCRRDGHTIEVPLTSLTFPEGSVAAWLQAAYLRHLGHNPGRTTPPDGWRLRSWEDE
jgi:hypothetical protein